VSILDHLAQIKAFSTERPDNGTATVHDRDARLSLALSLPSATPGMFYHYLLIAERDRGSILDGRMTVRYEIRPEPHDSAPFTNLQRLLVKLPEIIP
jgi:hypothetical protein